MRDNLILTSALAALMASGGVAAQVAESPAPLAEAEVLPLAQWAYDPVYAGGWSAEAMLDAEVYGPTGEEIGEMENIVVGPDGMIQAIIIEVGGFWDIGDTHVAVPWDQVEIAPRLERVVVPVTEESVEDYGLYGEGGLYGDQTYFTAEDVDQAQVVDDDLVTGPRLWKVSELLDDNVVLEGGVGYGYVRDMIFDEAGSVEAVVVNPDVGYGVAGPYAYPFYGYGYGWRPGLDYYGLPYGREDLADLEPFEYERLEPGFAEIE